MIKKFLLTTLLLVSVSQAAIQEILPRLTANDLNIQTQARLDLLAACSTAGRPGAEAERKAVCEDICAELNKGGPVPAAIALVRGLQRIGGEESIATLVPMLGSSDPHLRDEVRQALAVNPAPAAGKALLAELKTAKDARWTSGLLMALGERGDEKAAKSIAPYLKSNDPDIFAAAAKALSRIGTKGSIKALAKQRSKESGKREAILTAALFETNHSNVFKMLYSGREPDTVRAVALLGLILNDGSEKLVVEAMASGNPALQAAVIEAALQRPTPALHDELAAHLATLPPHLQIRTMAVLKASQNRAYAKSIEPLLQRPDTERKNAAVEALAWIGTAQSVPAILASGSDQTRRTLGMLNADGVDAVLEQEAAKKGNDARRALAIDVLALRGRHDLIQTFFAYAAERSDPVAKSGVSAIVTVGDFSNLEQLTELMSEQEASPIAREILKAIIEIMRNSSEQGKAIDLLVAQMDGASPRVQAALLQALAQVASKEALQPILTGYQSPDENLRKQTLKLIGSWKNINGLPDLLVLAEDDSLPLTDHVVIMRGITRLLAAQSHEERWEDQVIQALECCRRTEEKKALITLLNKAHTPEGQATFKAALDDPELAEAARAAQE
jgi:HEAT repeat protein